MKEKSCRRGCASDRKNKARHKYGAAKIWRGRAPRKTGERMFRPFSLEGAVCKGTPLRGKGSAEGEACAEQKPARASCRAKGTPPYKRNAAAQKKRKGSAKAEIFIRFSKSCRRTLIKYDILDKSVFSGAKEIFGRIYGKENNRVRYRR